MRRRILEHGLDRCRALAGDAPRYRYRYRYRAAACGWAGRLAAPGGTGDAAAGGLGAPGPRPDAGTGRARQRRGRGLALAAAALVASVSLAAISLVWQADAPRPALPKVPLATGRPAGSAAVALASVAVPPAGWHSVGEALPARDPRRAGAAVGLQLRQGCVWGQPGRDPYRGAAEQALRAAGLPDDVVSELAGRIARGDADGEMLLSRDGIRSADGARRFEPRLVASTHGMTLCFDTQVNFAAGHVERAPVRGHRGRRPAPRRRRADRVRPRVGAGRRGDGVGR